MASPNKPDESMNKVEGDESNFEMLDMLSEGEDEFDVDLMACGCRLAVGSNFTFDVDDVMRLFNLDEEGTTVLIGELVERAGLSGDDLVDLADRVARREITRERPAVGPRSLLVRRGDDDH